MAAQISEAKLNTHRLPWRSAKQKWLSGGHAVMQSRGGETNGKGRGGRRKKKTVEGWGELGTPPKREGNFPSTILHVKRG